MPSLLRCLRLRGCLRVRGVDWHPLLLLVAAFTPTPPCKIHTAWIYTYGAAYRECCRCAGWLWREVTSAPAVSIPLPTSVASPCKIRHTYTVYILRGGTARSPQTIHFGVRHLNAL